MTEIDVQRLLALAADRSAAARAELAFTVSDFLVPDDFRLTEQQRALMQDILGKLIRSIEQDVRANLAEALIRARANMPELEKLLANDDIEVARPVLERSSVLTDNDLIEVIHARTEEHRLSIALRDSVSEPVTDALVAEGGGDVIEALLRNGNANLSRRAMEYLVGESKRVDRFQEPLLQRHDLPVDLAHRMYWWVSAAWRKHILSHFTMEPDLLERLLQEATKRALSEQDPDQSARGRALRLARQMIAEGEAGEQNILRCLRQNRISLFLGLLAETARIDFSMAWKIVSDRSFESFIVLGRAMTFSQEVVTSMVLLLAEGRSGIGKRSLSALTTIADLYQQIDPAQARGVLALWQRDQGYQAAVSRLGEHD
jgi:uncharacterized protein (DUF2336 family)